MNLVNHDIFAHLRINNNSYLKNNGRLGIVSTDFQKSKNNLVEILKEMIHDRSPSLGYYAFKNIFDTLKMHGFDVLFLVLEESIKNKMTMIRESISYVNLNRYLQICENIKKFTTNVTKLFEKFVPVYTTSFIKIDVESCNVITILHAVYFYEIIFKELINHKSFLYDLQEILEFDTHQIIEFMEFIVQFFIAKKFVDFEIEIVSKIEEIINNTKITDKICQCMNELILNDDINSENKIVKILSILINHSHVSFPHYLKYFQSRITNPAFSGLELELELVEKISKSIPENEYMKLISMIRDISETKLEIAKIHEKIKSSQKLRPVLLNNEIWGIQVFDIKINYPRNMKKYLNLISRNYSQNKIKWQPIMGIAKFEIKVNESMIHITCNILQAVLLFHLNENNNTTIKKFSEDTLIDVGLAKKLFESLFEANLIIFLPNENDEEIYTINYNLNCYNKEVNIIGNFMQVLRS